MLDYFLRADKMEEIIYIRGVPMDEREVENQDRGSVLEMDGESLEGLVAEKLDSDSPGSPLLVFRDGQDQTLARVMSAAQRLLPKSTPGGVLRILSPDGIGADDWMREVVASHVQKKSQGVRLAYIVDGTADGWTGISAAALEKVLRMGSLPILAVVHQKDQEGGWLKVYRHHLVEVGLQPPVKMKQPAMR